MRDFLANAVRALVYCVLAAVAQPANGAIVIWGLPQTPADQAFRLIDVETAIEMIREDPTVVDRLVFVGQDNLRFHQGGIDPASPTAMRWESLILQWAEAETDDLMTSLDLNLPLMLAAGQNVPLLDGMLWESASMWDLIIADENPYEHYEEQLLADIRALEAWLRQSQARLSLWNQSLWLDDVAHLPTSPMLAKLEWNLGFFSPGPGKSKSTTPDELSLFHPARRSGSLPGWITWIFEMPRLTFVVIISILLAGIKIVSWMWPVE